MRMFQAILVCRWIPMYTFFVIAAIFIGDVRMQHFFVDLLMFRFGAF
jgi:hypothetical protein